MNLKLIGEENLPNVYIESVDINAPYSSGKTRREMGAELQISFKVYDALNRRGIPYFSDYRNNPKKQILLIVSKDPKFTELLTNSGGKLDPKTLRALPGYSKSKVHYEIFTAKKVKLSKKEETEIFYNTKVKLRTDDTHAAVFTCVIKEYADFYDNGPITSELVVLGGETAKKAFYFVERGTNLPWTGAVHKHPEKGFMGGSYHTNGTHPLLDKVSTVNLKIRDNRVKNNQPDLSIKKYKQDKRDLKNYHFGKILTSQSENGALNFIFNADIFQIVKDYTETKKLSTINEDLFYRIASQSEIKQLELYYNTRSSKEFKLISRATQKNGTIETTYTDTIRKETNFITSRNVKRGEIEAIVEELILNKEPELKTFNCQINKKDIYQIKANIVIKNPLKDYLNNLKREVEKSSSNLKKFRILLNKPINYNKTRSKTTLSFKKRFAKEISMWFSPIRTFEKIINLNSKIDSKEKAEILSNMFFMLNPKTLTKSSCDKALRLFSKEYERFMRQFDLKKMPSLSKNKANRKSNLNKNEIIVSKVYTVDFKRSPRALDLMPTSDLDKQIPLMRVSQMFKILTFEANRYNVDLSSQKDHTDRSKDIFFVSPKFINYKSNRFDVTDLNSIKEEALKKIVEDSNFEFDLNLFSSHLFVQRYTEKSHNLVDPVKQMGKDSPFQTSFDVVPMKKERADLPKNKSKISSFSKNKNKGFKKNKELFSASSKSNLLASRTRSEINKIPVHLKDLTYKEKVFGTTKEEFLLKEPYKRSLMYENLYKINLLSEITLDSKSRKPLNNRSALEIDEKKLKFIKEPMYCVMNKYTENGIVEEDNEFKSFTPINTVFIVVPNNWNFTRQTAGANETSSGLSTLYDQMNKSLTIDESLLRTNVTKQSQDREEVPSVKRPKSTKRSKRSRRSRMAKSEGVEKVKTNQQSSQDREEAAKKRESDKIMPKAEPKKPSKQEKREKRKQKSQAKVETTSRTQEARKPKGRSRGRY